MAPRSPLAAPLVRLVKVLSVTAPPSPVVDTAEGPVLAVHEVVDGTHGHRVVNGVVNVAVTVQKFLQYMLIIEISKIIENKIFCFFGSFYIGLEATPLRSLRALKTRMRCKTNLFFQF